MVADIHSSHFQVRSRISNLSEGQSGCKLEYLGEPGHNAFGTQTDYLMIILISQVLIR